MSALKSVQLAIAVADRRRELADRDLLVVQRAQRFAHDQLDQLEVYAAQTDGRWAAGAQAMTTPQLLHHHGQFMQRLRQAIEMQREAVTRAAQEVEQARQALLLAEVRLASLKQLQARKQAALAAELAHREQKQTDEAAAMLFARGIHHLTTGERP